MSVDTTLSPEAPPPNLLTDESGQSMMEKALILIFLMIPVLLIFSEVIDGFVSYYSYVVGIICLPIP